MMDDDYADFLLSEASSDIAAFHQFLILYKEGGSEIHLFFEGEEDGLYYVPEVRRRANHRMIYQYDCGGKLNVSTVRDMLKVDHSDCSCLFFIDRDFDDYLSSQTNLDDRTYLTDGYSVENHLCCGSSAAIAVQDLLKLTHADPDYLNLISQINLALDKFHLASRPLIAWIIAAKEEGRSPNLRNTKGLSKVMLVNPDGSSVINTDGFDYFKRQVLGATPPPRMRTVLKWRRRLDLESQECWMRGKYLYWFFPVVISKLVTGLNQVRADRNDKKIRIPSSFREGRLFECMGGRVIPPDSLVQFLNNHIH